jgi:periplasmic divalent cation tolerance protein
MMQMQDEQSSCNGRILVSTFSDEQSLINLSKTLIVEKKLCACVNYTKINSLYVWESELKQEEEFIAFFKTTSSCIPTLKAEILAHHPYKLPEIVIIKMDDVSSEYLSWIINNTHKNTPNL